MIAWSKADKINKKKTKSSSYYQKSTYTKEIVLWSSLEMEKMLRLCAPIHISAYFCPAELRP